jgi:multiple sugar transport system substrate-binding protein
VRPEKFFPGIWATNVVGDSLYGVPWYVDTRLLFYRTDLLSQAGYDSMPTTWDAWREALRRIKSRMRSGQHPVLLPTNEWAQPVIFGMQAGAELLKDDGRFAAFSGPRFRQGFDFYTSLFREGLAPVVSAAEVANKYQEFARGNLAMVITGPWEISEFPRRLPAEMQDRWATAPLPGPSGPGLSTAGGSSVVIFRGSRHKAEAWKLVEYLARPEVQLRFRDLTGNLPAHRDAWRDSSLAASRYTQAFGSQLERVRPLPAVPEIEEIVNRVAEAADRVIRGRQAADESLRALDREVDRLLEKRRWMMDRKRP